MFFLSGKRPRRSCVGGKSYCSTRRAVAKKSPKLSKLDKAQKKFKDSVYEGPIYICTSCHRLMYKKGVSALCKDSFTTNKFKIKLLNEIKDKLAQDKSSCKREKKLKIINCVLAKGNIMPSFDGRLYTCHTCKVSLKSGKIPLQSKANGFTLDTIPKELEDLNDLERHLIAKRICFMKLLSLPRGQQRGVHGPCLNVPASLDSLCTLLPRLPSESHIIPLKLKRRLKYKRSYMFKNARPAKMMDALVWLKENNPLYEDVNIQNEWENEVTDCEMMTSLLVHHEDDEGDMEGNILSANTEFVQSIPEEHREAASILAHIASDMGLEIYNVPSDGNCLFSAVCRQMGICGIQTEGPDVLRLKVADFLSHNPKLGTVKFVDFLPNRISNSNRNKEEYLPMSGEDGQWEDYVDGIRKGNWGDHICIHALAELLNVNIQIISNINANLHPIIPQRGTTMVNIKLGLVSEFHYVSLEVEKEQRDDVTVEAFQSSKDVDEEVELRGLPYDTSLQKEDIAFSVAPSEGQKPCSILEDEHFEQCAFPTLFPKGNSGFKEVSKGKNMTPRKYFNQRILDVDGRFGRNIEYLMSAQYAVESKDVMDQVNIAMRQSQGTQYRNEKVNAGTLKNPTALKGLIQRDQAYKCLTSIRGTPAYWQRTFYEVLAMHRQLGIPTWFFTLSAADMQWPDVIISIARQYGQTFTEDQVNEMGWKEKSNWLKCNPVTAARHFEFRLDEFFQKFLKSPAQPLGEITEYVRRIEFQMRGSPHMHGELWVKGAPKIGVNSDQDVIAFIDKYQHSVVGNDNPILKELVRTRQTHKHNSTCWRNGKCRFNFPKPISNKTLIARQPVGDDSKEKIEASQTTLKKVQEILSSDLPSDTSIDEVLKKAQITEDEYMKALSINKTGTSLIIKRNVSDIMVNNYNPDVLTTWQANMDLQFIVDPWACVMYITSYMLKSEKGMGEVLKNASKEIGNADMCKQMRYIGAKYLNHREISAQETSYRLLSLPLRKLSRQVVYIPTCEQSKRVRFLKPKASLVRLENEDEDVYCTNIIDRYKDRSHTVENMCLADFVGWYVVCYGAHKNGDECHEMDVDDSTEKHDDEVDKDVDEVFEEENLEEFSEVEGEDHVQHNIDEMVQLDENIENGHPDRNYPDRIKLIGGTFMKKRKRCAVIRFHKPKRDKDAEDYCRTMLMLYYPWRKEENDLKGESNLYSVQLEKVSEIVSENERNYTVDGEKIEEALDDLRTFGPPEHAWSGIVSNLEAEKAQEEIEGIRSERTLEGDDLDANESLITGNPHNSKSLKSLYGIDDDSIMMTNEQYYCDMRGLNTEQKRVITNHRRWCKDSLHKMDCKQEAVPYFVFLSGPGGVGKSHVIKLLKRDTIKLLSRSRHFDPEDVVILLMAPTGCAAFNIDGMTIHSSLSISPFGPGINTNKLNTLQLLLKSLMVVIIDEISMVGSNMLNTINTHLQLIKGNESLFGNVTVVAVGDLYQLKPVEENYIFGPTKNIINDLMIGSLFDVFECQELTELMRQKDDKAFGELLNRVRISKCTTNDIDILKSRCIEDVNDKYPHDALHVFAVNAAVDKWNANYIHSFGDNIIKIDSIDSKKDDETCQLDVDLSSLPMSQTGNLVSKLEVAVNARVMITVNIDISDGLVNGATGKVEKIITIGDNIQCILVKFDHSRVGKKALKNSHWLDIHPNAIPIYKHESRFSLKTKKTRKRDKGKSVQVRRRQFPITLFSACTIHKMQGQTVDQIVIDMSGRFGPGQAYVALSRVTSIGGLYLKNFDATKIRMNTQVDKFMHNVKKLEIRRPITEDNRNGKLLIGHLNVRSYMPHMKDIKCSNLIKSLDGLGITEANISENTGIELPWDKSVLFPSMIKTKTDVIFICPEIKKAEEINCTKVVGLENVCVRFHGVIVMIVYRRPGVPTNKFIEMMDQSLTSIPISVPFVLMGDFNEDLLKDGVKPISTFLQLYGLKQHIMNYTTDYASLLDHVYCNDMVKDIKTEVEEMYFTDHDLTIIQLKTG